MTSTLRCTGRLCNHLIRNVAVSLVAKKNNLFAEYGYYNEIQSLGIDLFVGEKKYDKYMTLPEEDIMEFLEYDDLTCDLIIVEWHTFQTKEFTNYLYQYFREEGVQTNIIQKNQYQERYKNNNDCYVHIRLGDVIQQNPGFQYYDKAISQLSFDNLYISSDSIDHEICKQIIEKYPKTVVIQQDQIDTIKFASTCKHIVLSHGTYSACIGYLAFFSDIYYPAIDDKTIWCGDIFSIPSWNCIEF